MIVLEHNVGAAQLILSLALGYVIGRIIRKRVVVFIVGLFVGVGLGLIGGFEIFPMVYPFMVTQINWVGVPEIRRVGLIFISSDVVLLQESIYFLSFSFLMISVLTIVSVIGVLCGVLLEKRYHESDIVAPWKESEQTE
ncbi:MAG: hypothetical protein ACFFCP_17940 [Promethearchaeota archaeon]